MLFNSFEFLFGFLPCVLVVTYGLRSFGLFRVAELCLIAASLFFYAWWDWRFLGLLLASAIFNWVFGSVVADAKDRRRARFALAFGVGVDLLVLAFFKYRLFFGDLFALNLGGRSSLYIWILPLGISFWTFEQIIYLVDCYRGEQRPLGIKDYLAFVTFFPRLIAGPIIRPRDFFKSYNQWQTPIPRDFLAAGMTLIAIGLFKKVCLADQLGRSVNPIFKLADDGFPVVMIDAWAATLGFAFQIYFDFSGYSDIAIGLALMLGIRLPANFDAPYKSSSIIEFWRRWHMSLSFFLRDYLYIPLGGNRGGSRRQACNIMITMGLGGLWHGAGINFFIWGLLHGCYVIVAHFHGRFLAKQGPLLRYVAAGVTFGAVLVAWIFLPGRFPFRRVENANWPAGTTPDVGAGTRTVTLLGCASGIWRPVSGDAPDLLRVSLFFLAKHMCAVSTIYSAWLGASAAPFQHDLATFTRLGYIVCCTVFDRGMDDA